MSPGLPVGKLPPDLLASLLARAPALDKRILMGPGVGLDCAIIDLGDRLLAFKSDPITFASQDLGWYAVQVNANDLATCGARPRWLLVTLLLPEGKTTPHLVESILEQLYQACQALDISVIGGHTEVTYGLERPVLASTMIGEVARENLVTPRGAGPGDCILLTKGAPIEAIAILGRELPERLVDFLSQKETECAVNHLYQPGISILVDAQTAQQAGRITAMHDPTEGGIAGALWELAIACGHTLVVDPGAIPILPLGERICKALGIDPLAAIASGALLLTVQPGDVERVIAALKGVEIACTQIGRVESGPAVVWAQQHGQRILMARPERDEIARLFETVAVTSRS